MSTLKARMCPTQSRTDALEALHNTVSLCMHKAVRIHRYIIASLSSNPNVILSKEMLSPVEQCRKYFPPGSNKSFLHPPPTESLFRIAPIEVDTSPIFEIALHVLFVFLSLPRPLLIAAVPPALALDFCTQPGPFGS